MAVVAKDNDRSGLSMLEPSGDGVVLTKSDTDELVTKTRALYVGGAGDLNVVMSSGRTVLFSAVPAGTVLPIKIKQLLSTSTTATLVVALL
jgi:hypothetical protein